MTDQTTIFNVYSISLLQNLSGASRNFTLERRKVDMKKKEKVVSEEVGIYTWRLVQVCGGYLMWEQ
jgi:hypothetical protein